jgi:hypothetical protein
MEKGVLLSGNTLVFAGYFRQANEHFKARSKQGWHRFWEKTEEMSTNLFSSSGDQ